MTRGKKKPEPSGPTIPVMCVRCARIYLYKGTPEATCPKCHFHKWMDPRLLCRDVATGGETGAAAVRALTGVLWHAADFVESEDISEDVTSDDIA